jgi:hypothetical protein
MRRAAPILILALLGIPLSASAKPSSASVGGVERCGDAACGSASPAGAGSIVAGTIRIEAKAQSGLVGLEKVRLEALPPDKANAAGEEASWVCLEQWFGDRQLNFSRKYAWSTPVWPDPPNNSQCPEAATHFHGGKPSLNGTYQLRVRAWDVQDDTPTASSTFAIKLANAPTTPSWSGDPQASGATVSLKWKPNREADVAEYRFVRVAPDGAAAEFAIDARNPAAQGCSKVSSLYYACTDRGFTRSGGYRYALVALRPAPGASHRCALSQQPCAESALSAQRNVDVNVPPSASSSPSASTSPLGSSPGAKPTTPRGSPLPPAPSAVPQTEAERHEALLSNKRAFPVPLGVLAGLLALLVAGGLGFGLWKGRISSTAKPWR